MSERLPIGSTKIPGNRATSLPGLSRRAAGMIRIPQPMQNQRNTIGSFGWGSSWFNRVFGRPDGIRPEFFSQQRNIGMTDLENAYQHRYLPIVQEDMTWKIVTVAQSAPLQRGCKIRLTKVQNIRWSSWSSNLLAMQEIGAASQPRVNTRNQMEWQCSGRRFGTAAIERMEILMDENFGEDARDWMINSNAAGIVLGLQNNVMGAMLVGGTMRYWAQTQGARSTLYAQADKQLYMEARHFAAVNRGPAAFANVVRELRRQVKSPIHLGWLPYNMQRIEGSLLGMSVNPNPIRAAAELTIDASVRDELGFAVQRQKVYLGSPTGTDSWMISNDGSLELYYAPAATASSEDDSGSNMLEKYDTHFNFFIHPSLGQSISSGRPKNPGNMMIYHQATDRPEEVRAAEMLKYCGWFDARPDGTTLEHQQVGVYPNMSPTGGIFSRAARDYLATMIADRRDNSTSFGPLKHAYLRNLANAASLPAAHMSPEDADDTSHMHVGVSFWDTNTGDKPISAAAANNDDADEEETGAYFFVQELRDMYPDAMPHNLSIEATKKMIDRLDAKIVISHESRRRNVSSCTAAFELLNKSIREIIRRTEDSRDLATSLLQNNKEFATNQIDGVKELRVNANGALEIPEATGNAEWDSKRRFFGQWTGPQLRQLTEMADGDDGPDWLTRVVIPDLVACLPVVNACLEELHRISPATGYLAGNTLPAAFRQNGRAYADFALTSMISRHYGDNNLWVFVPNETAAAIPRADGSNVYMTADQIIESMIVNPDAPSGISVFDSAGLKGNKTAAGLQANLMDRNPEFAGLTKQLKDNVNTAIVNPKKANLLLGYIAVYDLMKRYNNDTQRRALGESLADAAPPSFFKKDFRSFDDDLARLVAAMLVTHKIADRLAQIGTTFSNASVHADAELNAQINKLAGLDITARSADDVAAVTDTAPVAGVWVRTTLGYAGHHIVNGNGSVTSACGNPAQQYKQPIQIGNISDDLLPSFFDGTLTQNVDVRGGRKTLSRTVRAIDAANAADVKDLETAARGRFAGYVPPKGPHVSPSMFSSPNVQSNVDTRRQALRMFRQRMYEYTHGQSPLIHAVCWNTYMQTPFTAASLANFYAGEGEHRITVPVDVLYQKTSQVSRSSDMLLTGEYPVTVFLRTPCSYLQHDTAHRFTSMITDLQSAEVVEDPNQVAIGHGVYVDQLIAGRNNDPILPDSFRNGTQLKQFWAGNYRRNMLVALEKVTHRIDGMVSVDNMISNELLADTVNRQKRITFSKWSSQSFTAGAFSNMFKTGHTDRIRHSKAYQAIGQNADKLFILPTLWKISQARKIPLFMQPYGFRGWNMPQDDNGLYKKEDSGDQLSPLAGDYFNHPDYKGRLMRHEIAEATVPHRVVSF